MNKLGKYMHGLVAISFTALMATILVSEALADEYPTKPITIIVPFSAGGGTDSYARTLGSVAYDELEQPMVVINRPGGGGYVGARFAADARNDGHTLMIQSAASFILGGMMQKRPVDAFKDFEPVAVIGQVHTGMVVRQDSPYHTVADLISAGKKEQLIWAHAGRGGVHHMAGSAFAIKNSFTAKDLPYKGGGNVRIAVIGGQVDFAWMGVQQIAGFEDQLRVLGVANIERDPVQNSYKTFKELGVDYSRFVSPITVYAPKGTKPQIINRIAESIKKMQGLKPFKKLAKSLGLAVMYKGPTEASAYLSALRDEWKPIVEQVKYQMAVK